jgi:hypothetical protein
LGARTAAISIRSAPDAGLAFLAGALSVLIFQMGAGAVLYAAGILPNPPYSMAPTQPLGIPQSLSGAFWGGLWGIVMLPVLRSAVGSARYWITAALFGGVVVGGVLLFIVLPLKGRPFAGGWNPGLWLIILVLHAVFGLGTALFQMLFGLQHRAVTRQAQ